MNTLRNYEKKLQDKPLDNFTKEENQLLSYRIKIPILPNSFLRQIETTFSNERSKCIYFVLHELEIICNQLKLEVEFIYYIIYLIIYTL